MLRPVTFKRNQTLHHAGEPVQMVYFVEQGICSMLVDLKNGNSVEVTIIGRDNFIGHSAVLGTKCSAYRCLVQLPGTGYSIRASSLLERCSEEPGELLWLLRRGIQGLLIQTSQTAACNRTHGLQERLSRWLLMCQDRIQTDLLPVTHELLANLLGARRPTVSSVAGILQKDGLIECSRGRVRIVNRRGLEKAACECYEFVHEEYVRLGLL